MREEYFSYNSETGGPCFPIFFFLLQSTSVAIQRGNTVTAVVLPVRHSFLYIFDCWLLITYILRVGEKSHACILRFEGLMQLKTWCSKKQKQKQQNNKQTHKKIVFGTSNTLKQSNYTMMLDFYPGLPQMITFPLATYN